MTAGSWRAERAPALLALVGNSLDRMRCQVMKNRGDAHHRYSALVADRRQKLDGSVTDDLSDIRRGGRGSVSLGRIFEDPLTRGLFDPSAPIHRLPPHGRVGNFLGSPNSARSGELRTFCSGALEVLSCHLHRPQDKPAAPKRLLLVRARANKALKGSLIRVAGIWRRLQSHLPLLRASSSARIERPFFERGWSRVRLSSGLLPAQKVQRDYFRSRGGLIR